MFCESAIGEVESARNNANQSVQNFLSGDGDDLHSTVLAVQRADLEFRHDDAGAQQSCLRLSGSHAHADVAAQSLKSMDQVKRIVGSLTARQLWTIVIVAALVAGGIYGLSQWQREAGFRPLYTTLAPEDAALVVQKLKESGVAYRISAIGNVISVPEERVAELRLEMASAGLPKSGRIGFEIFDKTNLGMTDFAEHINYRRALEGELERSVMAIDEVEQARVHISFPQESVFQEARQPAKASVLLHLRGSAQLAGFRHSGHHAPDFERRGRPGSRIRFGSGHARQSSEPRQARGRHRLGHVRGGARIPPHRGAGSGGQAGRDAGASGGRGQISRRRFPPIPISPAASRAKKISIRRIP